jgi:hypothetical protein
MQAHATRTHRYYRWNDAIKITYVIGLKTTR